ncbi:MAG: hypothetical protein ABMA13_16640 [Chthoniobacteraceae bacterium]
MKSLLLVAIFGAAAFLCWRAYENERTLREAARVQSEQQLADTTEQARMADEDGRRERDQLRGERDIAVRERDDARQQAVAAQTEIARLTNTTPKPENWFQKRLDQGSGKLDAPPAPAGVVRKSQPGPNPAQPSPP